MSVLTGVAVAADLDDEAVTASGDNAPDRVGAGVASAIVRSDGVTRMGGWGVGTGLR